MDKMIVTINILCIQIHTYSKHIALSYGRAHSFSLFIYVKHGCGALYNLSVEPPHVYLIFSMFLTQIGVTKWIIYM